MNSTRFRSFGFGVFFIFSMLLVNAQSRIITGTIINSDNGFPLPGVEVRIINGNSIESTNADGEYHITVPDTLNQIVFESFPGMRIDKITRIGNNEINLSLTRLTTEDVLKLSFEELMNLKVTTASKSLEKVTEASAVITVLSEDDIDMYAARDLSDVIELVVGAFIYGSYYLPNNMVSLRGEVTSHYCTHILLLLNGRPIRSSKEGYFIPIIRAFPLENIERIEILRGPGSALYGSGAYAGIVNIITKKGENQAVSGSLHYGSFGTGIAQLAAGFEKEKFSLSVAGYLKDSKGWDYKVRGATPDSLYDETNTPAIERSKGVTMVAGYKDLSLNFFAGSNYQMIGQHSQGWWYADEWYLNTTRIVTDLGYEHEFGQKLTTSINFNYNFLKYRQPYDVHANDIREWGIFNDFIVEATGRYMPYKKLVITIGGLTNTKTGYIRNTESLSDGTPYNVWTQPKNPDPFFVVPEYNETWWSVYSNIIYAPFDFLNLTVGAHANKVKNLDLDIVPRIGAVLNFKFPLNIKLLYGEAFRSPDFFELYSQVEGIYGNAYLKPEKIRTFEGRLSYSHKRFKIALTYFNSTQKNIIGRSLESDNLLIVNGRPQPIFINSEALYSQGVEFEGDLNVLRNLVLKLSSLYQVNENSFNEKNIYGLPNLFLKAGVQYSSEYGIKIGLFNMWVSPGNEFDVPYPKANPPATAFNYATAKISFNLTEMFDLYNKPDIIFDVSGFNLFDEQIYYPEYGDKVINTIPGRSGFSVIGGLKITL